MEYRILTAQETKVIDENCKKFDKVFAIVTKNCANCNYPMNSLVENYFSATAGGRVCGLCHDMEWAISLQPGLKRAHFDFAREKPKNRDEGVGA